MDNIRKYITEMNYDELVNIISQNSNEDLKNNVLLDNKHNILHHLIDIISYMYDKYESNIYITTTYFDIFKYIFSYIHDNSIEYNHVYINYLIGKYRLHNDSKFKSMITIYEHINAIMGIANSNYDIKSMTYDEYLISIDNVSKFEINIENITTLSVHLNKCDDSDIFNYVMLNGDLFHRYLLIFLTERFDLVDKEFDLYIDKITGSEDITEYINDNSNNESVKIHTELLDKIMLSIDLIIKQRKLGSFYLLTSIYSFNESNIDLLKYIDFENDDKLVEHILVYIDNCVNYENDKLSIDVMINLLKNNDVNVRDIIKIVENTKFENDTIYKYISSINNDEMEKAFQYLLKQMYIDLTDEEFLNCINYVDQVSNINSVIISAKFVYHTCLSLLLTYDVDTSYVDDQGNTVYHYMCLNLMEPGASILNDYTNNEGKSPSDLCILHDKYYNYII